MAKPRMTIEGSVRDAVAQRPETAAQRPGRWKKVLLWAGGIFVVLLLLFCIFVVNVFEGSAEGFTAYIPRRVDFFLLKKDTAEDLGEGYEPLFLPKLRASSFWSDFRTTGDFDRRILESGVESALDELVEALKSAPIDLVHNLAGQEVAFAGRAREGASAAEGQSAEADLFEASQFALHLRVRWKVKLAYRGLQWGFASTFDARAQAEAVGDHLVLKGIYKGRDLLLWRHLDMLVVSNDAAYMGEIQALAREAGGSRESFRAGNYDYQMMERERAEESEDVSEAFFIFRPKGVMSALGLVEPIPVPPSDPRSTLVGRFLGQIFSSELVEKVAGYGRASTNPLSIGPGFAGLRLRGQVQLRDIKGGADKSIDAPERIEDDREAFLRVTKAEDGLALPPVSDDELEKTISTYAGLVPDDVAIFAYLAGDLSGLFHLVERSLAPSGKPGEDWDREEINRVFHAAIAGNDSFGGYNRAIEALRTRRMSEIPQEAARLARQYAESVGKANDTKFLELRTEAQQVALEGRLPRPIILEGEDGDLGLRKLLDRLAQLFARDGEGRGIFVLRQNDYPDMREQNPGQIGQIPAFYRPKDPAPVWAFVFWIEQRSPDEVKETVATFLQQLRFSADPNDTARSLDVHVTSEVAGQHTLKEYWHASIPGPGEIVTAVVPFYEEQQIQKRIENAPRGTRRSVKTTMRNDIHLFVISNHMMLAQDIAQAAILPARTRDLRARPRLDAKATFDTMLRRELDSRRVSSLFAYWNGVELAEIEKDRLASPTQLELAIQEELDNPTEQRRLFKLACEDPNVNLAHIYKDTLPLERLWKSVPPEKESLLDQRIDQLRRESQREMVPRMKMILERRASYPQLVPHGILSVSAVSSNPLKVDFQLFAGIDLSPAHE